MKIKLIVFNVFLFLFITNVMSQDIKLEAKTDTYIHSLGAAAGFTTGYGLSYRYTPNKFGLQVVLGPSYNGYSTNISFGLTFLYKLIVNNKSNLFLYQGNHMYYSRRDAYHIYEATSERIWFNGIGIGFEFLLGDRVSFNLMGGYAGYNSFESLNMTGEIGLFYNF